MGKFDESDVIQRFLRYVQIDTQSDEESGTSPSTEKQKKLGELLTKELQEMGVEASFDSEHVGLTRRLQPAVITSYAVANLLICDLNDLNILTGFFGKTLYLLRYRSV